MPINIYVGNLPLNISADEVRKMFEEFGAVDSVDLLSDRYTGESRGFGFVKMDNKAGRTAIDALDKKAMGGRTLNVNEARPRASGGGFQQRGQGGAFGSGGRRRY